MFIFHIYTITYQKSNYSVVLTEAQWNRLSVPWWERVHELVCPGWPDLTRFSPKDRQTRQRARSDTEENMYQGRSSKQNLLNQFV